MCPYKDYVGLLGHFISSHGNLTQTVFSFFWSSEEYFLFFFCTVSECDGEKRTHNGAAYTWRFGLLS